MRKGMVIGLAAAAAASAGCGQGRADNGGPTVQRNFEVGGFERIHVAGPYDVRVKTGGGPSVSGSGPEKVMERLVVEVKGDRLLIHPRKQNGVLNLNWGRHGTATIEVTVPQLREAMIAGSGEINVDRIQGDRFEGAVAGSGDLRLDSLEVQALKLSIAGSGDLRAGSGQARNVHYSIAGSGSIDASGVRSEAAEVSIAGSGSIAGQATGTADVSIMGSGDVVLTGGAKCKVSKAGSGNVRCS